MNPHKNCQMKEIWFKPEEYKKLTDALDTNETDKVLDIMFEIWKRGDL